MQEIPTWVWFVLPIGIAVTLGMLIYRLMNMTKTAKTVVRSMRQGRFLANAEEPTEGPWAQAAALGAPLSATRMDTWNGLKAHSDEVPVLRKGLSQIWGVDTKQDWQAAVTRMLDEEFGQPAAEAAIDVRRQMLAQGPVGYQDWEATILESGRSQGLPETSLTELTAAVRRVQLYEEALAQEGLLPGPVTSLLAYDYGRGVTLTRWAGALNWVEEDEAKDIMRRAVAGVVGRYRSWEEYGAAYVLGRCIGFDQDSLGDFFDDSTTVLRELLDNPKSPWVLNPWPTAPID